jgi:hypothetical protein
MAKRGLGGVYHVIQQFGGEIVSAKPRNIEEKGKENLP